MVQHAEEPREPSPAIGNQARSRAQTREAGLGIPQPPPTLPSSLVREFTPLLVTCDASAYCCAFAGAHSICCWRLCGPGTLPGIDGEKLNVSHRACIVPIPRLPFASPASSRALSKQIGFWEVWAASNAPILDEWSALPANLCPLQYVPSWRASLMILVTRLERRSRQRREAPSGSARRNISSTC